MTEAITTTDADATVIYVPPPFAGEAIMEAADAFEANDSRAFYFHVRRLLPHKAANHPLRTFKGKVAQDPLEGRKFCQEHFSSLTCAKIVSPASLVSCSHLSHTTAKGSLFSLRGRDSSYMSI